MKNTIKITAILLVFLSLISLISREKDFHVTIEQNGKTVEVIRGTVRLDKTEFNIVFEFSEPMGLLINGSFKKETYKLAYKGKPMADLPGFESTGMAEGLLNPNKELFILDDGPSYWFFDDEQINRFNMTEKINGKILCKRTIQNLVEIDTKNNIKIEDVQNPLYLVFISYKRGESISDKIEIKREWIKIKWNK